MENYCLKLSEKQMQVTMLALEEYFRVRYDQWRDLADDIARNGYVYDKDDAENREKFNDYMRRRDDSLLLLQMAGRVAMPKLQAKPENAMVAEDMWAVLRHEMWKLTDRQSRGVDSYPPLLISGEPAVDFRKEDVSDG